MLGQGNAVQRHLEERAVLGRVAHQNRAAQRLAVARDDELLVDARDRVGIDVVERAGRRAERIADRRHVDAHQLQLRAHVGAGEPRVGLAREMARRDFRHLIARRDESVDASVPQRAFAHRVDVGIGRPAMVVDHDAAALADRELRRARELVVRPDAGGIHDEIRLERGAVGEHHPVARAPRRRRSPSCSSSCARGRPAPRSSCAAAARPARRAAPPSGAARTRRRAFRARDPSAPSPLRGRGGRRRSPCRRARAARRR